jgi:hypothetical protein
MRLYLAECVHAEVLRLDFAELVDMILELVALELLQVLGAQDHVLD